MFVDALTEYIGLPSLCLLLSVEKLIRLEVFLLSMFLLIGLMFSNWGCISISTMKHQQTNRTILKSDLSLFHYGSHKCMFVNFLIQYTSLPNCVHC